MDGKNEGGRLLKPKDVAIRLGVEVKTLANWRAAGIGPRPFIMISAKAVRYPEDAVAAFLAERTVGANEDDAPFGSAPMTDDEIGAIGQFDGSDDEGEPAAVDDSDFAG